jgi:hypothetical protein
MHKTGSLSEIQDIHKLPAPADEVKKGITANPPLGIPPEVMATIQNDDERMLARIGYRQVCFRLLSLL